MLSKVIKDEYIQLDVQANNFEEAIRKALQPFLEADLRRDRSIYRYY